MRFSSIVFKNVVRRPLRSGLTAVAISIAIGAVVALVGVAQGFEQSFVRFYETVGVDLFVVPKNRIDPLSGTLNQRLGERIRKVPGVAEAIPGLADVLSFDKYGVHGVLVNGWEPETIAFEHLTFIAGRPLTRKDTTAVVLGTVLAGNMNKSVGDTIEVMEGEPFTVVGVYRSFNVFENGFMIIPLKELQRILDRPGQVNGYSIVLTESGKERINAIRQEVEAMDRNISVLPTKDHIKSNTQLQIVKAMAWVTSAIALVIGMLGIMNTMVMTVHERTREIGILRAVGWRPKRVLRMILFEAVVLSQAGALLGAVGAVLLLFALARLPATSAMIAGDVQPWLLLLGFLIAAAVGLLGGLLPAWQAARLLPTAALRQE